MEFKFNDGGRSEAGYKGDAGDCVCRSIAIALELPYQKVYDELNHLRDSLRQTKRIRNSSSRNGCTYNVYSRFLTSMGWEWIPTMLVGQGCKVHLKKDELPEGRIICRVSKHMVAVIDGVVHDTFDPSRDDTRCVYGYWKKKL